MRWLCSGVRRSGRSTIPAAPVFCGPSTAGASSNCTEVPNVAFLRVVEAAAPAFDIAVTAGEVSNAADIERVLPAFAALAARLGLPAIYSFRFYAASGGLMSYGIDQLELVRAAASYVDRILRGTNPGELPVQLPTKFELVINLKTAAALGLTVPNSLQLLAEEVIE